MSEIPLYMSVHVSYLPGTNPAWCIQQSRTQTSASQHAHPEVDTLHLEPHSLNPKPKTETRCWVVSSIVLGKCPHIPQILKSHTPNPSPKPQHQMLGRRRVGQPSPSTLHHEPHTPHPDHQTALCYRGTSLIRNRPPNTRTRTLLQGYLAHKKPPPQHQMLGGRRVGRESAAATPRRLGPEGKGHSATLLSGAVTHIHCRVRNPKPLRGRDCLMCGGRSGRDCRMCGRDCFMCSELARQRIQIACVQMHMPKIDHVFCTDTIMPSIFVCVSRYKFPIYQTKRAQRCLYFPTDISRNISCADTTMPNISFVCFLICDFLVRGYKNA